PANKLRSGTLRGPKERSAACEKFRLLQCGERTEFPMRNRRWMSLLRVFASSLFSLERSPSDTPTARKQPNWGGRMRNYTNLPAFVCLHSSAVLYFLPLNRSKRSKGRLNY